MKTIQVSDELYESLVEISKRLNNQNHLCTAMPYIWTIEEKKMHSSDDDGDGFLILDDEGGETGLSSDSKANDFHRYIRDNDLKEKYLEWRREDCKEGNLDTDDLTDFLECECNFRKWSYQYIETYKNFFLTQKACEDHIKQNHYHYNNPKPYLFHAWRNPEMEAVQKLICEISGGKLHT